jgi:hypothetical protein
MEGSADPQLWLAVPDGTMWDDRWIYRRIAGDFVVAGRGDAGSVPADACGWFASGCVCLSSGGWLELRSNLVHNPLGPKAQTRAVCASTSQLQPIHLVWRTRHCYQIHEALLTCCRFPATTEVQPTDPQKVQHAPFSTA